MSKFKFSLIQIGLKAIRYEVGLKAIRYEGGDTMPSEKFVI